ncbi:MAG: hypothetical protein V3R38_01580 [bacterium]
MLPAVRISWEERGYKAVFTVEMFLFGVPLRETIPYLGLFFIDRLDY